MHSSQATWDTAVRIGSCIQFAAVNCGSCSYVAEMEMTAVNAHTEAASSSGAAAAGLQLCCSLHHTTHLCAHRNRAILSLRLLRIVDLVF